MKRNCAGSSVQWAISWPAPEEMPDYLVDGYGTRMQIVKSAPYDVQVAQYNVYRLVQLLDRIPDVSKLPPMTEPNDLLSDGTDAEAAMAILAGIYVNYSERRRRAGDAD